jgi:hypothetical protein
VIGGLHGCICHCAFTSREPFRGQSGCTLPGVAVGSSAGSAIAAAAGAVVGASEAAGLVDTGAGDGMVSAAVGTSETGIVTSVGAEVVSKAVGPVVSVGGWLAAGIGAPDVSSPMGADALAHMRCRVAEALPVA